MSLGKPTCPVPDLDNLLRRVSTTTGWSVNRFPGRGQTRPCRVAADEYRPDTWVCEQAFGSRPGVRWSPSSVRSAVEGLGQGRRRDTRPCTRWRRGGDRDDPDPAVRVDGWT